MDDEERRRASTVLGTRQDVVLPAWITAVSSRLAGRTSRQELDAELRNVYTSMVGAAAAEGSFDETRAVLAELSRSHARQGFSPTETATVVTALKEPLAALAREGGLSVTELLAVDAVIDELALSTFETYVKAREQVIVDQTEQLLELSTPVVKLWEGVVAVPLVGTLDSARTQLVMENLLQALVDSGSEHAIIDITGVPAVDTQVAQHLLKTVFAARLMGAECIVSGIRPQIAQTIVALGIEFGDIVTKATLADALVACLRARGIELGRRSERSG